MFGGLGERYPCQKHTLNNILLTAAASRRACWRGAVTPYRRRSVSPRFCFRRISASPPDNTFSEQIYSFTLNGYGSGRTCKQGRKRVRAIQNYSTHFQTVPLT